MVEREWAGETVVCIGGGPSLTKQDVAYVQGKARVIAINDAYRLAPWADVLYACDHRWWELHRGVPGFAGKKYGMTVKTKMYPDVIKMRMDGVEGLCLKGDGLRTGRNSGYQAINLAVLYGAARVLLLGYDMAKKPGSNKSHWFGNHPHNFPQSPYEAFRREFRTIVEPLAAVGVEVVNCSRWTALTVFPCQAIEVALPMWAKRADATMEATG